MANINSISSNSYSSSSSIYGNRNVLTGLASGMDTETMIQNSVTGYQTKIQQLQQSQTKLEWKQDAYRELIDQMYNITDKYTSYASSTNLSSNTFFTSNVTTAANGTNASAVTATGKASSDIQLNAVTQLATSARYAVDAGALDLNASKEAVGQAISWGTSRPVGQISGTMTLRVGSTNIDLRFTEDDQYANMDDLLAGINEKLAELDISRKGESMKASSLISAEMSGNTIRFVSKDSGGDAAYINSVSGNLATTLGAKKPASTNISDKMANDSFTVPSPAELVKTQNMAEYLNGKTIDVNLDGTIKQIKIGDLTELMPDTTGIDAQITTIEDQLDLLEDDADEETRSALEKQLNDLRDERDDMIGSVMNGELRKNIQNSLNQQFGTNKVTVGIDKTTGGLRFDVQDKSGSTVKVASEAGEALGIGKSGVSNYFNTSNTLRNLLGTDWLNKNARTEVDKSLVRTEPQYYDAKGNRVAKGADGYYYQVDSKGAFKTSDDEYIDAIGKVNTMYADADGNRLMKDGDSYYRVNDKGDWIYSLEINGAKFGEFTEDSSIESVMTAINSNAASGVKVSYSNLTSQFVFTATETGATGDVQFNNALAKKLFEAPDANAPANQTLGDIFGNTINWDADGNATLKLSTISDYLTIGTFNKDSSVKDLVDGLKAMGRGYENLFSYDEETRTYAVLNGAGKAMDASMASRFGISAEGDYDSGARFTALVENANARKGFTAGTDAVVQATVNGKELTLKRSSNVFQMDGLSVTLKEEFSAYDDNGKVKSADAITFTTSSNADVIVDAVKSFVEDVNKLMTSVHDAYATQPVKKTSSSSSGGTTYYEPLTEDDKKDMSESAVTAYEEKAKTGLLFGDSDLRTLYDKLLTSLQSFGADRIDMESIGLTTAYSGGVTTLKLNETELRSALESNPDKVRSVFAKTMDGGSSTNGLMANLKTTLNSYASISSGSPGILVSKAGTKLSALSLLNNNLQKQLSNLDTQIERWQTKLSDKIDYYTKQFTQLEQLMSTMNNQSSMLADMMGY